MGKHLIQNLKRVCIKVDFKRSFKGALTGFRYRFLGLGTQLFVKVLQPEDSEVTFAVFKSRCHLLLPV